MPLVEPLRSLILERVEAASAEPNPYGLLRTSGSPRSLGQPIDASADSKAWHALATRAGLNGVRLHDARHFTVDLLYVAGVPEVLAMKLIGHSLVAMTRHYRSGASPEALRCTILRSSAQVEAPS
ncbi:tyrosine-type recombinase/integrase [Curtobacterium sp. NPDC087080]|uniref:tyrosine-type recombinase/integrase n=1 Tax=Curtobacterium sp. NPDC087080 TaxID=3363965 RepID=UPI0037F915F1